MKLDSLINNVQNNCDIITNSCIKLLSLLSKYLGISYGELNVYIFLIIIPIIIIFFITTTLISLHVQNKRILKIIKHLTYLVLAFFVFLFILFIIFILNTPIEYI